VSNDLRDDEYRCGIRPDTVYNQIFNVLQIVLYAAVPPCLMIISGLLTIYNASRLRVLSEVTMRHLCTEGQDASMYNIFDVSYTNRIHSYS
jgi:hypothetical protein